VYLFAGLSRFHVLRAFADEVGVPPHAYQIALRVERARILLGAGTPLAEAAHWLKLLAGADLVYIVIGLLTFEFIIEG
ncbi:MAG TPA: hypothetical protein VFO18_02225, partial [Methylomirabilota bacterium]|nr:hypothetical protein [Methylomirabilota bacterium]